MKPEALVLTIERTILQESIRRLRKVGKGSFEPVRLGYANGTLTISWTSSSEQVPAIGQWPGEVHVPANWLRALAKAFPLADPLTLRVEDGRLVTESLSCALVDPAAESDHTTVEDSGHRIARAVAALKAFRVRPEDVEELVEQCELAGSYRYRPDEDRLLRSVADAWVSLAVFGVDADAIYRLVQKRIRHAWTS